MEEIEKLVYEIEEENNRLAAASPDVRKSLEVVEQFLKHHPVMCYGGTAINNLLPPESRFYDPAVDIPDYDFFSKTPQEHAVIIANKLVERGIPNVEVKPGMHLGTFKVFADFIGVADITFLDEIIFERLWKENITKNKIHYVTPNFLRMSMYLELSRPRGDVSRWMKVYGRLQLLNEYYPVTCKKEEARQHQTVTPAQKKQILTLLKNEPLVLMGVTASEIHMDKEWTTPVMLLGDKETIERLVVGEKVDTVEETEFLPKRYSVQREDGSSILRFYETTACHSYHTMQNGVRVVSIPTILQFFFAYIYSNVTEGNIASMLCIAQRVMDIAAHKPERRFDLLTPRECIGTQETLIDMKREKAELYEKLSKNKSSADYTKYFFSYNPRNKTEKSKTKKVLKKTRKERISSDTIE